MTKNCNPSLVDKMILEGIKTRITEMQKLFSKEITKEERNNELHKHFHTLMVTCMPVLYLCLCGKEFSVHQQDPVELYRLFCERGIKDNFYPRNKPLPDDQYEWECQIKVNDPSKED